MPQARHKIDSPRSIHSHRLSRSTRGRRRVAVPVLAALAVGVGFSTAGSAPAAGDLVSGPELVVNGSFEDGLAGWRTNDRENTSLAVDRPGVRSNQAATLSSSTTHTVVLNDLRNVVASTTAGSRYAVSAQVRSSEPRAAGQVRVREMKDGAATTHAKAFWLTDTDWHEVSFEFDAIHDGSYLDLNVLGWGNPPGRTLSIDLVSMSEFVPAGGAEAPVPAPPAPGPTDPGPTDPAPTDPAPTDPAPTTPAPTTPAPTTPAPTTPAPTTPAPPAPAPPVPAPPVPAPPAPAPPSTPTAGTLSNGCAYNLRGLPSCGTYFGSSVQGNGDPAAMEREAGKNLGVHRTYFSADQVDGAVAMARADLAKGRLPWISFKLPYSWGEMAQGRGDDWARQVATRLRSLDGPVWVAFHHEPEGDGDIRDWTAMQEHLSPIIRAGAPNAAYTVILTAWNVWYGDPSVRIDSIWPDTTIDVAGFDVYNQYGVVRNGSKRTKPSDLRGHYFEPISAWAKKRGVAWGIAETGYTSEAATVQPDWITKTYADMQQTGGVAMSYFNSTLNSIADWDLSTGTKKQDFARALRNSPTLPPLG